MNEFIKTIILLMVKSDKRKCKNKEIIAVDEFIKTITLLIVKSDKENVRTRK